ncbi:hypothetical protein JB92DRAFT_3056905, partial [Gautieria morchelliformis]
MQVDPEVQPSILRKDQGQLPAEHPLRRIAAKTICVKSGCSDIDAVGSHRSPATPPHASSSAQSMDSEAPPSTPDDPAAASDSQPIKEWEEMMQRSRLAANTWLWERAVPVDWKKAMKDPNLPKLRWNGVPTKLRSA